VKLLVAAATVHTHTRTHTFAAGQHMFLWDGIDPRPQALGYKCQLCAANFRMGCSGSWKRSFVIWELELVKWGKDTLIQGDSGGKVIWEAIVSAIVRKKFAWPCL